MRAHLHLVVSAFLLLSTLPGCEFDAPTLDPIEDVTDPGPDGGEPVIDPVPVDPVPVPVTTCPGVAVLDLPITKPDTYTDSNTTTGMTSRHVPSCVSDSTAQPDQVYRVRVTEPVKISVDLQTDHWSGALEFLTGSCERINAEDGDGSPSCVDGRDTLQLVVDETLRPGTDYFLWVDGSDDERRRALESGTYRVTIHANVSN